MKEESDFRINRITIIGLGLIGGSLGLSLKERNPIFKITGIDKQEIINKAIKRGAVDEGTTNIEKGVKEADILIIATPVKVIMSLFSQIKPFLKDGVLITDTGSTKKEILLEAERVFSDQFDFIGGHPLAGLEKGGIENACPGLFKEKPYLIVSKKENSFLAEQKISFLIKCISAREIKIDDALEHDQMVALISHLPQLIAVVLTNMYGLWVKEKNKEGFFKITGKVFQEMTRVAASPFDIWKDIYQTNTEYTIDFIEKLIECLEITREKIARNPIELQEDFEKAKLIKEKIRKIKMMD
ncbi:MAG: hypothetical protein Kow00103_00140 [Candidatus Caldatribacteriota bacterium]